MKFVSRVVICSIETEEQKKALFRFRYEIYVEEMHRPQRHADHERRTIVDNLDETGINIVGIAKGRIVGAIRNNASSDSSLGEYENFYQMQDVGIDEHPAKTSITTRLMIAPEYRRAGLAVRLASSSYLLGLKRRVRWNFIDCNQHLVSFFQGLGWIEYVPPAVHPEYGLVSRMRLDLTDRGHLEAVRSPFAKLLREFEHNDPES